MIDIFPSYDEFARHYDAGKTQILYVKHSADFDTALSAYYKLTKDAPYSFLLESVEGGAHIGRYSIIACRPDMVWQSSAAHKNPLDELRTHIKRCKIDIMPDHLPPACSGGLYGYLGYEMVRYVEPSVPNDNLDTLDIPEGIMMRPKLLAVFDNVKHELTLSVPVLKTSKTPACTAKAAYDEGCAILKAALEDLNAPLTQDSVSHKSSLTAPLDMTRNFTDEGYCGVVRAAKDHIIAGDAFQIVPSQRFRAPFDLPAIDLYRALRRINPSPFLFHLKMDGFALVGSSPEILVRVEDGEVTVRPIAGTRPRGKTAVEDAALAEDLLGDEKERAEHLMLIDLGRNDVGRVAKIGSVRVTEDFIVERYSHVMHIVSNVVGQLRDNLDCVDALFSGFPAGTVSGAPKIRAMQLIHEFENEKRGFYAGCVGYFDGLGNMNTCIALRTALVKAGEVILQAGAGIVADSDPASENQECISKAQALVSAAEAALRNTP
tara:strand:+ start:46195 stop:47664 length:1470 start_codon:yes stop_codon:yes gene_type:complete